MALRAPRGTADFIDYQALAWNRIRQTAFDFFARYGYQPIETPTFEQLDVFVRGIGEATDVVGKEMFLVNDKSGLDRIAAGENLKADEQLALRPEMTAGVCRAVVEHNLVPPDATTVKLVYAAPMYRHERPQKGRMREFHQIGVECLGAAEPSADAEVIVMLMRFFEGLGIPRSEMRLLINSMGDDACRPAFRDKVHDYILDHRKTMVSLCEECVRRADTNPLRAFDCKNPNCQMLMAEAPRITDELCEDCKAHYTAVKLLLDCAGLAYEEDPRLVRGLDYYTRTVFEVQVTSGLGSQNAIGGGGRYDKLIQEFGGRPTPGLGFAVGFERILMAQEAAGKRKYRARKPKVFVAAVDESSRIEAFHLAQKMRDEGIPAVLDLQKRSMNSQFRQANKSGMKYVVIIDDSEHNSESVNLKNMTTGEQQSVYKDELIRLLKPKKTNTSDR